MDYHLTSGTEKKKRTKVDNKAVLKEIFWLFTNILGKAPKSHTTDFPTVKQKDFNNDSQ